ncbi:hypothetical protein BK722_12305 [Bacillus thuringiensis serovar finitimus]|nr:hypothetical protein YBT020_28379 [Bacillus thuringiensis serovar finitimus YBT-020]OTX71555.1 hypothetical protein BK722_12305 [Bacillus thuringiensis serovar finitimus]OTY30237.1 hypothetical protein BK736_27170 [Bacillus thuringiensis serovar poloniensis]
MYFMSLQHLNLLSFISFPFLFADHLPTLMNKNYNEENKGRTDSTISLLNAYRSKIPTELGKLFRKVREPFLNKEKSL